MSPAALALLGALANAYGPLAIEAELLADSRVDALVLHAQRQAPLIEAARGSAAWQERFADAHRVLLVRRAGQ